MSIVTLLAGYIEKLVLPVSLTFLPGFTPPASLFSVGALRAVVVLGLAAAASFAAWRNRAARFAIVLVVIPLLPTLNLGALNQGLESAFAERYLYLPSVGFVMLVAMGIDALRARGWLRPPQAVAAVVILTVAYAAATMARNPAWKDHVTLWSDTVAKSPGNAVARMNYGAALIYAGRQDEGTAEMRKAATTQPALVDRQMATAAAYLAKGLEKKAILALHTALVLDPKHAPAHYNLGLVYESQGQAEAAAFEYQKALVLNQSYSEAHNNLGVLYAEQGRMDMALRHFREAVRLRPGDPEYRANLERAENR
jgi:Flp pilus assembly protein TadD